MKRLLSWFNNRFLFIGILVLLVFIPLYPKFPFFQVPKTYVAIRFEDFLVTLLIGFFLLKVFLLRINLFKDRLNRIIFLYFLVGGLSVLSAILITKNVLPHLVIIHWIRRVEYMALFFVAAFSIRSRQDVKDSLSFILLTTILVALYGIGQKYLGFPVVSTMNEEFSKGLILTLTEWARVNSTFAGHYDLAAYTVLILSLTIGSIVAFKKLVFKIIAILFLILFFYLLTLTASQVSFVAYFVSVVLVLILSKKYFWIIPVLALSVFGLLVSQDLNKRYMATIKIQKRILTERYTQIKRDWDWEEFLGKKKPPVPTPTPTPTPAPVAETKTAPVVRVRLKPTPTPTPGPLPKERRYLELEEVAPTPEENVDVATVTADRSFNIRMNVEWPRSLRAFYKNPLLGTGYSSITLATDNDYLRSLGETGILGFISFSLIFLEIIRRFIVFLRKNVPVWERSFVIAVFGSIVGFILNAMFIDVFESSKVAFIFWILVGMMVAVMNYSLEPNKNSKSGK